MWPVLQRLTSVTYRRQARMKIQTPVSVVPGSKSGRLTEDIIRHAPKTLVDIHQRQETCR